MAPIRDLLPLLALTMLAVAPSGAAAASNLTCERPGPASVVAKPPALHSQGGMLNLDLNYVTSVGPDQQTRFCFVTDAGLESPTLYVKPGDTLNIKLTNRVPPPPAGLPDEMDMTLGGEVCGAAKANEASVNMHFHGTNTSPKCHSDEVIHTLVNSGQTFRYEVHFPANEPPGITLYHPHVHHYVNRSILGGATGAIVVEGLEKLQPQVAGLPVELLLMRDQKRFDAPAGISGGPAPSYDVSLNYVPIIYPALTPAVLEVTPGRKSLWRVVNAAANTNADFRVLYDGVAQPLGIVALDGVPTDSQDGTRQGKTIVMSHVVVPPAGRVEFILTGPSARVRRAVFQTAKVDTGPAGDSDPTRTLAVLRTSHAGNGESAEAEVMPAAVAGAPSAVGQRFAALESAPVTAHRRLYFSETPNAFYITVEGETPHVFRPGEPPTIVTRQGAVEKWTIQNRSREAHEFHIHQLHFKLLRRDGAVLPPKEQQFLDTVNVPFWTGTGPYPSVTLLMDFRDNIAGDFVYHCHIARHEDGGMMAIIRVRPPT